MSKEAQYYACGGITFFLNSEIYSPRLTIFF